MFKLDGIKTINKILKKDNYKYNQKIQETKKELEKSEEYINIDAKIKDKAQKDINELNILKDMHEKINKINDKDTSVNELIILKDTHEEEIKN